MRSKPVDDLFLNFALFYRIICVSIEVELEGILRVRRDAEDGSGF